MTFTVGVVGGGQLARMMIAPATELGIDIRVLAEADGMSAAIAATATGDYRNARIVLDFARDVDVITFDHEHVPQDVLRTLEDAGVRVHPSADALQYAQDKLVMRTKLAEIGAPQPSWAHVRTTAELDDFIAAHGGTAVVKTPRGGYDGKGVSVVRDAGDVAAWWADFPDGLLVEEAVAFTRELAQQVARRGSGETAIFDLVETMQRDGVCAEVFAPAPGASTETLTQAARIAADIAEHLDVTGMLAVELFETAEGNLLVNELAMRPHNSGHWTQDGALTSQFEQHLRAVLDLPLGSPARIAPAAVMVNILGGPASGGVTAPFAVAMAAHPDVKIHTYGKTPRPGRKVGHINAIGSDLDVVAQAARDAARDFT